MSVQLHALAASDTHWIGDRVVSKSRSERCVIREHSRTAVAIATELKELVHKRLGQL